MSTFITARRAIEVAHQAAIDLDLHISWTKLQRANPWIPEVRYRPDQPRAPRGTATGGQWIDDLALRSPTEQPAQTAAVRARRHRCVGIVGGCSSGGGTHGVVVKLNGKLYCWQCAVKKLGIEEDSYEEQKRTIGGWDPMYRD